MGDFNLEPNDPCMRSSLNSNSVTNLIKTNTCFKVLKSCIDLILTNILLENIIISAQDHMKQV